MIRAVVAALALLLLGVSPAHELLVTSDRTDPTCAVPLIDPSSRSGSGAPTEPSVFASTLVVPVPFVAPSST